MSVAFRRENDDEHKEPRFELPLPAGRNLVTPRGRRLTEAKVSELEAAIVAESDDAAREVLRRDLRYWQTRLATAEIAARPDGSEVAIGTRVRANINGAPRTIHLVGHDEADPAADRLAFSAPLARAMLGAEAGERLDFAGREEAIEVLSIEPAEWLEY